MPKNKFSNSESQYRTFYYSDLYRIVSPLKNCENSISYNKFSRRDNYGNASKHVAY